MNRKQLAATALLIAALPLSAAIHARDDHDHGHGHASHAGHHGHGHHEHHHGHHYGWDHDRDHRHYAVNNYYLPPARHDRDDDRPGIVLPVPPLLLPPLVLPPAPLVPGLHDGHLVLRPLF